MVEVKIKLDEGATMPHQANSTDSGYDLVATSVRYDEEGDFIEYGTGVYLDIPPGYEVLLYPRSSISKYGISLCNGVGLVDESYKKEILLRFKVGVTYDVAELTANGDFKIVIDTDEYYIEREYVPIYKVGDKVAQMVVQEKAKYKLTQVDTIEDTGRGGFGSSDGQYRHLVNEHLSTIPNSSKGKLKANG